jgi:tRNA A37 threonylcarbamoyladenosine modification protein TsaB
MQIGFYEDNILVDTKEYSGLTSDIFISVIDSILKKYSVDCFIYTSGPGSHMATKIVYVALKSLAIIKDIDFKAVSAFDLNNSKPIKALGKIYFIKEKETIITKRFEESINSSFFMPKTLNEVKVLDIVEPNYNIAAV